jgi:hypothetical protein
MAVKSVESRESRLRASVRPAGVSISDAAAGFRRGIASQDPDGHAVQLRAP